MAKNASVERFRKLTEELRKEVHDLAVAELNAQANDLAQTIKSTAPVYQGPDLDVQPGALRDSVRVIPDRRKDTVVRVAAGGEMTFRVSAMGVGYDYARAVEFGTSIMPAEPFFFPTYRLRKKKMIGAMKRRITASIKKRSAEK